MDLAIENKKYSILQLPTTTLSKAHIVCWQDNQTNAQGWLVIDQLINGVSGGGLFMHENATLEETKDLAKTMSLKNSLQEPRFGGAKAGVKYNPNLTDSLEVLSRFLQYIKPYIEKYWCTGGDINTSTSVIDRIVKRDLHLPSAFFSLGSMVASKLNINNQSAFLLERVVYKVNDYFTLDSYATGFTVATCIKTILNYKPRVLIQGWGKVGASLAYTLHKNNIATVVGICDASGWVVADEGLDVLDLIQKRDKAIQGSCVSPELSSILSKSCQIKYGWQSRKSLEKDEDFLSRFLETSVVDVFCPCAARYQITPKVANTLVKQTFKNNNQVTPSYIVSGANNIFAEDDVRENLANFSIESIPEWLANCGNAILYGEILKLKMINSEICERILKTISDRVCTSIYKAQQIASINQESLYSACFQITEKL